MTLPITGRSIRLDHGDTVWLCNGRRATQEGSTVDEHLSEFASAYAKALERWASEARDPGLAKAIREEARRYRSLCRSRERQLSLPFSGSPSLLPVPSSEPRLEESVSPAEWRRGFVEFLKKVQADHPGLKLQVRLGPPAKTSR